MDELDRMNGLSDGRVMTDAFEIAGHVVDPRRNTISDEHCSRTVEPKVMDVLCELVRHRGAVVAREELIDKVWGRAFGADESLTRAISLLRKAFADSRERAGVIETVPKRGYRITGAIADVPTRDEVATRGVGRRGWAVALVVLLAVAIVVVAVAIRQADRPRDPAAAGGVTVEVLALTPEAGDRVAMLEAVDLSRQLSSALARGSLLRVTRSGPDADARGGPAGGDDLALDVGGTVGVEGGNLVVAVELRDAKTQRLLWTQKFQRASPMRAEDRAALERVLAAEVYNRILIATKEEIRRKQLADLRPWELNLLATWVPGTDEVFIRPHGPDRFWPQIRALQLDPRFAAAHATLASGLSYDAMFTQRPVAQVWRESAATHAEQATALGPYDADVLYPLATYSRQIGDRRSALALLDRVLTIQPEHPIAALDRVYVGGLCGPGSRAAERNLLRQLSAMSRDDPVRWVVLSHLADIHLAQGNYALATTEAEASRRIVKSTWNGFTLATALGGSGRIEEAAAVARELKLEWPELEWGGLADRELKRWCIGGDVPIALAAAVRGLGTSPAR